MKQLGLDVVTCNIYVIYPLFKHEDFLNYINEGWTLTSQHNQMEIATLLGCLQTASTILLLGTYFSIRLQQ